MFKLKFIMKSTNYYLKTFGLIFILFFIPILIYAQNITVKGVVKDTHGELITGASVAEKGTTNGTITDIDGKFSLNMDANGTLNISFVGYKPETVKVNGKTSFNVTLGEDNELLDEVVVVGYGTQRKSDVTGAIVSVNDKSLREIQSANISQALQGRLPGISISQTSTRPGQSGQIRIRGSRSLNASNDPLIVLDGIPFEGSMNDINPSDIKSIDILKDASATAIYGSRGANGVILVTTSRGEAGKARVTYNGSYGIKDIYKKYEVFNGEEFTRLRNIAGAYTNLPQEQAMVDAGMETDWQDLMYQTGYVTQHDVGLSGGNQKGKYSFGIGYYDETTVLPGQGFKRLSLKTTIDQEIGNWLKVGVTTNTSYGITDGESASFMYQLVTLSPLSPAFNEDGSYYTQPSYPNENYYNPLFINNDDSWEQKRKRFSSFNSLYGEINFTDYLKYRINVGLSYRQDNYGHFYGSATPFRNGEISQAAVQNALSTSWTVENLLYFEKTFNKKHKLNLTGMYSAQESMAHTSYMEATDLIADYMLYYNLGHYNTENGSATIPAGNQSYYKTGLLSYMFRANYGYDNRYAVTVTGRRDGASVLATGHKWHTYPAAAFAWNVSNEEFAKDWSWLDMMKLRFGYGQTANQSVGAYSTLGSLTQNKYNFGDNYSYGYYVSSLANSSLGWEHTDTYNLGLDFSVLNSRLSGSIEYYTQNTKDLLLNKSLPSTSGVPGNVMVNLGETENWGMEFSLSGKLIETKDFSWNLDANIYFNRNKIVKLDGEITQDEGNGWFVGHPIDVIYDYKKLGIWQLDEADVAAKYGFEPGDIKIADIDNNGEINTDDRTIIGNYEPKFEGGFTSRMAYKNFDFTIVGFYRVGGTLVSTIYQPQSYANMLQGRRNQIKVDYWTPTNPTNAFPKPSSQDRPGGSKSEYSSTLGYYDAGFLKIRSVTLGYTFSDKLLKNTGIASARVYCTLQNPLTLFSEYMNKVGGIDPEATGKGNQGSGYSGPIQSRQLTVGLNTPSTRNYLFGVNISF